MTFLECVDCSESFRHDKCFWFEPISSMFEIISWSWLQDFGEIQPTATLASGNLLPPAFFLIEIANPVGLKVFAADDEDNVIKLITK